MEINLPVIVAGRCGGGRGSIARSRGRGTVAGGRRTVARSRSRGVVTGGCWGSVAVGGWRGWRWRSVRTEVSFPLVYRLFLQDQVGTPHLLHGTPGLCGHNVNKTVVTTGDIKLI